MATSTFAAKITDLVGGTIDDNACDDWMTEGAKEIINQLPAILKEKCMTATGVGTDSVVDLDGLGEILYVTRKNADSGYYTECRKIPSSHGGLATDSTDLNYYATATDPVYWVDGDTSGAATLYVKPTPTANQPAILHHIGYPTVNNGTDNTIANFPDEAESLVVLYAAIRQLLQYQSTMSSDFNSNINTALGAITRELNKADDIINTANGKVDDFYTSIGDIDDTTELWDDTNKRFKVVRDALLHSQNLLSGNAPDANYDVYGNLSDIDVELGNEDIELAGGRIQQASTTLSAVSTELNRANVAIAEINTIMASYNLELQGVPQYISTASGYISQAAGYVGETGARLQADTTKYQWYGDQYVKLSAEYARGLEALKGT